MKMQESKVWNGMGYEENEYNITNINNNKQNIMKSKIIDLNLNTEANNEILNEFLSTISREQIFSVQIREHNYGYRALIIYSI